MAGAGSAHSSKQDAGYTRRFGALLLEMVCDGTRYEPYDQLAISWIVLSGIPLDLVSNRTAIGAASGRSRGLPAVGTAGLTPQVPPSGPWYSAGLRAPAKAGCDAMLIVYATLPTSGQHTEPRSESAP